MYQSLEGLRKIRCIRIVTIDSVVQELALSNHLLLLLVRLVELAMLCALLTTASRPRWSAFGLLVVDYDIWIYICTTDDVGRDLLHTVVHDLLDLASRLAWLLHLVSRNLTLRELLHLRGYRVIDIRGLRVNWYYRLASLRLTHILVVSLVEGLLLLDGTLKLLIVFKWLCRCLLERKVCAVRHLLRLVVLLRGQTLNQLVVLLDLLLVVLHRLQLQIYLSSIFKQQYKLG